MELVYLWVEGYKNIKRQGFNFSPKFTCDYDENKNKLTINENDDYIENFFGDNINVTAIVGKNGSGKSSVLEILATFSYDEYLDEKTFLVFFDCESFSFKQKRTGQELDFQIINKTIYKYEEYNKERTVDSLYFGNELSTIFNNNSMGGIESYEGNINAFKNERFFDVDNPQYRSKEKIKIDKYEIFNKRFTFILRENNNILSKIDSILIFDKHRRGIHFYEMQSSIASNKSMMKLVGDKNLNRKTIFEPYPFSLNDDAKRTLFYKLLIVFRLNQYEVNEGQKDNTKDSWNKAEKKVEEIINNFKSEDFNEEIFNKEIFVKIHKIIGKYDGKDDIFSKKNIDSILQGYDYKDNDTWIEKRLTPINISLAKENSLLKLLSSNNIIRVDFLNSLDDSYNYFSLSSGERNYIEIFVTYIYHLITQNTNEHHRRKHFFLFDEIDLGLHPNWQKRLIRDILYFANKYFKHKIQLIFTSHSPFLLSDIPKENIIFLDKEEKGNCKVLTHDEVLVKKQTFGLNIHTLLSDSFFMEDGLMGEFAKTKIESIKDFYEKVNNSDNPKKEYFTEYQENIKKFQDIQRIIGEPFLKTIMGNYLDELHLIFSDDKTLIDKELQEIEARKQYLEELKNAKN